MKGATLRSLLKRVRSSFKDDPFFWNVNSLLNGGFTSPKPSWHLAYTDDIIAKASGKDRNRIDQNLCDQASDMAMISEGIDIVDMHQPRVDVAIDDDAFEALMVSFGLPAELSIVTTLVEW